MTTIERQPTLPIDLQNRPVLESDPFQSFLAYREMDPTWTDDDGGAWIVTRYDQVREVQQDYRTFTHTEPRYQLDKPLMPSFFDPPQQTRQRSIILPLMTPEKIEPLEPRMHAVCRELIAGFKEDGHCEANAAFARRYPIAIFSELYGLPEERREEFRILAETFLHHPEQMAEAWTSIRDIIQGELEARRETPRDDMLTGIASGKIDGELIPMDTAVNLASTVFLGGLDTLPSNIGWTLRYLADHPAQRRQIIEDPACIPVAVEEFFRMFPSVARNEGRATKDVEFHGSKIRKGDRVVTMLFLANTDSAVFEDPLTLDFNRKLTRHLSFSPGSHRCLGSHLARHELAVALEEWHAAIPDYRIADPDKVGFSGGGVFATSILPLEWDV